MINGDKRSVTQWLTVASCNCVCLTALTRIVNYPQHPVEKGLEAKKDAGFTTAIGKGSRLFSRSCMFPTRVNAYFMAELWEWGREKGDESKRTCIFFFWGVHTTETALLSQKKLMYLAFCTLCDCVHVWVRMIIKSLVCGLRVGVRHDIKFCIQNSFFYSAVWHESSTSHV